jgi:outer membrane protein, heavy metal efflux system
VRCVVLVVVAMLGVAREARAQEMPRELTLKEAITIAETRAPTVTLARGAVKEAAARRVGTGFVVPSNPRLQVEGRPPITGGTLGDIGYGGSLEVPLDLGGGPGARMREADRGVSVAQGELSVEAKSAKATVWSAYIRVHVAQLRIAALERAASNAQRMLDATRERVRAGASGETDELLAAVEVGELGAARMRARGNYDAEMMALRDSLDLPANSALSLVTPFSDPPEAPAESALAQRAQQNRPELALSTARTKYLLAVDERLGREVFPRFGVYAGVDAAPVSPIFGVLGLSVELPVAQRNKGPRAVVAAAGDLEQQRRELLERRVLREVLAARAEYVARVLELREIGKNALPASERAFELVEIGWRAGHFDVFRLTSGLRELNRIRVLQLDAFENAWLSFVRLDQAVGGLSP